MTWARWVAVGSLVGCLDPTEVTVVITTDVPCSSLQGTSIRIGPSGGPTRPAAMQASCDSEGNIGTIVVLPDEARTSALIEVTTGIGMTPDDCTSHGDTGGCIVARRSLGFLSHTSLSLPIAMQQSCVDVPCDVRTTCVNGACQPIDHIDLDASVDATPDASPVSVQFVEATGGQNDTTNLGTFSFVSKVVPGELIIVTALTTRSVTILQDSSWSVVSPNILGNDEISVFYKLAGTAEPATYTFNASDPAPPTPIVTALALYKNVGTAPLPRIGVVKGPLVQSAGKPITQAGSMFGTFFAASLATWTLASPGTQRLDEGVIFLEDEPIPSAPTVAPALSATMMNASGFDAFVVSFVLAPP